MIVFARNRSPGRMKIYHRGTENPAQASPATKKKSNTEKIEPLFSL